MEIIHLDFSIYIITKVLHCVQAQVVTRTVCCTVTATQTLGWAELHHLAVHPHLANTHLLRQAPAPCQRTGDATTTRHRRVEAASTAAPASTNSPPPSLTKYVQ